VSFFIGQLLRVATTWTNEAGETFNPHSCAFSIKDPAATVSTPSVQHPGLGKYEVHVHLNLGGTWWYRSVALDSEGNEIGADEGPFEVKRSEFPSP